MELAVICLALLWGVCGIIGQMDSSRSYGFYGAFLLGPLIFLIDRRDEKINANNRSRQRECLYYYLSPDGNTRGPVSANQIKDLTASGEIVDHTPIAASPNGPWRLPRELKSSNCRL